LTEIRLDAVVRAWLGAGVRVAPKVGVEDVRDVCLDLAAGQAGAVVRGDDRGGQVA